VAGGAAKVVITYRAEPKVVTARTHARTPNKHLSREMGSRWFRSHARDGSLDDIVDALKMQIDESSSFVGPGSTSYTKCQYSF
jgi:hypothetical protein